MRRLLLAFLPLFLLFAAPAFAHTRSETHSAWRIDGNTVHLSFAVPDIEAKRLSKNGADQPSNTVLGSYLQGKLGVTAEGKACPMQGGYTPAGSTPGYRRFEFTFECPSNKEIVVATHAFFEMVPSHVNFAQVQTGDGEFVEQLMVKDQQSLSVTGAQGEHDLQRASFLQYIQMGVMHIFTGVDHMSFLVGLVLISRRTKDLLFVVTGFTLGHSATLALAVTGLLRPHAEYIDALVALTIALIGAENIAVQTHKPAVVALGLGGLMILMAILKMAGFGGLPALLTLGAGLFTANYLMISGHLADAGRLRLVVTLVFGLIHGFGFAADLVEQQIPPARLAELLVGFNLGVEIGQISLVLVVLAVAGLLVKLKLALPRPLVTDVAAAWLVGIGLYWFLSRAYA
jgi:hypothetical protein